MSAAIIAASMGKVPAPHIGIEEFTAFGGQLGPAGAQQNAGRDVFLERRLARCSAVPAPCRLSPDRSSARVMRVPCACACTRTLGRSRSMSGRESGSGAQRVDDRIFQFQGAEVRVIDRRMAPTEVACERGSRCKCELQSISHAVSVVALGVGGLELHRAAGRRDSRRGTRGRHDTPLRSFREGHVGGSFAHFGCAVRVNSRASRSARPRGELARNCGLILAHERSSQVVLSSVYLSKAWSDLSRPKPDCLKPPKGTVMSSAS